MCCPFRLTGAGPPRKTSGGPATAMYTARLPSSSSTSLQPFDVLLGRRAFLAYLSWISAKLAQAAGRYSNDPSGSLSIRGASKGVSTGRLRRAAPAESPSARVRTVTSKVQTDAWKELLTKRWNADAQFLNLDVCDKLIIFECVLRLHRTSLAMSFL